MNSLQQTSDGGYILGGASGSAISGDKSEACWGIWDYWIIKTDASGIKQWDEDLGGTDWEDVFGSIIQTQDHGYLACGTSYSPISGDKTEANLGLEQSWIVKTDSSGIKEWDKTIFTEGHDEATLALQASDGCYVIGVDDDGGIGGYKTDNNWGGRDYWFVKFCDTTMILPPPVLPSFAASDTDLCEKFCINFFDSSANNPFAWEWIFEGGDPATSGDQNPANICYNSPGIYDVTLITTNASGTDTTIHPNLITVHPTPPIPAITQTGSVLTSTAAAFYQWQLNSVDIPGATNQSYTISQSGYYTIVVSDTNSCQNSFSDTFLITGIADAESGSFISVFPNPTAGKFKVSYMNSSAGECSFSITNTMGQKVFTAYDHINGLLAVEREIDFSDKPSGVYFIETAIQGKSIRKKLVILH